MERTILFKAKCLDNAEWVEGDLLHTETLTFITWFENGFRRLEKVDPSTVCQFTGLKDKNGNDIFEGDIITNGTKEVEVKWSIYRGFTTDVIVINPISNNPSDLVELVMCKKYVFASSKFDRKHE